MIRIAISQAPIIAAMFIGVSGPALAETLFCSTSFQGIRVCTGPGGYVSREWQWQDRVIGDDSDGRRWTSSPWRDGTITTVRPGR